MRYAFNEINQKIEVTSSGERAKCPDCNSIVIGRKGSFKVKHWYHKSKNDCDGWYEPITEWHLKWQNLFPKKYREISIKNDKKGKSHRADVRLENGLIIEIQNSPISVQDISARESFYGKKNMIWVLNGEKLAKNSRITYQFNKKRFELFISIPSESKKVPKYDMDEFKSKMWKNDTFYSLRNTKDLINFKESNGHYFKFEFGQTKKFSEIESELSYLFRKICNDLYGNRAYQKLMWDLTINYVNIPRDYYSHVHLDKKYWRNFIDLMTFPVFFDNLRGLENDTVYWYQKNRIVKLSDFTKKYLQYT